MTLTYLIQDKTFFENQILLFLDNETILEISLVNKKFNKTINIFNYFYFKFDKYFDLDFGLNYLFDINMNELINQKVYQFKNVMCNKYIKEELVERYWNISNKYPTYCLINKKISINNIYNHFEEFKIEDILKKYKFKSKFLKSKIKYILDENEKLKSYCKENVIFCYECIICKIFKYQNIKYKYFYLDDCCYRTLQKLNIIDDEFIRNEYFDKKIKINEFISEYVKIPIDIIKDYWNNVPKVYNLESKYKKNIIRIKKNILCYQKLDKEFLSNNIGEIYTMGYPNGFHFECACKNANVDLNFVQNYGKYFFRTKKYWYISQMKNLPFKYIKLYLDRLNIVQLIKYQNLPDDFILNNIYIFGYEIFKLKKFSIDFIDKYIKYVIDNKIYDEDTIKYDLMKNIQYYQDLNFSFIKKYFHLMDLNIINLD